MKIEIASYRAMTAQVKRLADAVERLTATYEQQLRTDGYDPIPDPKIKDEMEVDYVDAEQELIDEVREAMGQTHEEE